MKTESELCVKELAFSLGVSVRYVYEMRHCGFAMTGKNQWNQTATLAEAVQWIEQHDFRMVNGHGVVSLESANVGA